MPAIRGLLAISFLLLAAGPASAHHSFAMFDSEKNLTLTGTVKGFEWTNPHIWIQLLVRDAKGVEVEWSIEGNSPNILARAGWTRKSLKPGDAAVIVVHPLKDGRTGGSLVTATVGGTTLNER